MKHTEHIPLRQIRIGDQLPWFHDEKGGVACGRICGITATAQEYTIRIYDPEHRCERDLKYASGDSLLVQRN